MIPVTNTANTFTTPPPIVNTTTPGTNELHVPPTTVAPSFSSPQVDNNARGNSTIVRQNIENTPQQTAANINAANVGVPQSTADKFTLGAQTNFLAQLIGQDITPSVQGVLAQYEKLVNISNVKYAPSNAFKPEAQPSSLFSKFLTADQPEPQTRINAAELAKAQSFIAANITAAPAYASPEATSVSRPNVELQNNRNNKSSATSFADEIAAEDAAIANRYSQQNLKPPPAISAYLNTASRVNAHGAEDRADEDPISQVA